jgi:hypothetical protein
MYVAVIATALGYEVLEHNACRVLKNGAKTGRRDANVFTAMTYR